MGAYLVERLRELGVRHVFGVPGDYVLGLLDRIVESEIEFVGTCNELNAGYAADAYARINGIGAAAVTYAVGGFSLLNAVAGAFAERVPLVAISGGPKRRDAQQHRLVHHTLGAYDIQLRVFEHVTVAAVGLDDAESAPRRIDETLAACIRNRRPVFIEVPADLVDAPCDPPAPFPFHERAPSDEAALAEAVAETVAMLANADRPLILGGVEVHRFGLREPFEALVAHAGYPVATALMGKSLIDETNPHFIGVYLGALSEDHVRETVEAADCVLNLGAFMSDIDLGIYTAKIAPERLIHASAEKVTIKHHHFDDVFLGDFMPRLLDAIPARREKGPRIRPASAALLEAFEPRPAAEITVSRFYERVNHVLDETHIVLADAGDSFMCAGDLVMHDQVGFISQAFYCSIGFTLPAALGVGLADPDHRAVVFIGDGAFQMTAQELSSLIRYGQAPIIFLMNNRGYTVERVIHDGPYNDLQNWDYARLPELMGGGWGQTVTSEGELELALARALAEPGLLAFIEVRLDPMDCSAALRRLGEALARENALAPSAHTSGEARPGTPLAADRAENRRGD